MASSPLPPPGSTFILVCIIGLCILPTPLRTPSIVLLTVLTVTPVPKDESGMAIGWKLGEWIMTHAAHYFGISLKISTPFPTDTSNILTLEPHDILPYPLFVFSPCLTFSNISQPKKIFGLMTTIVFRLPFVKHIYTFCRAGDVSKKNFIKHLQQKNNIVFIPGGVQEVLLLEKGSKDIILYLKKRKGFIKLALLNGSNIIPVFSFGVDGSYDYWLPKNWLTTKISRYIGFTPMIFFGRFGIPLFIPHPKKISVVTGTPILIPKFEGTDEELRGKVEEVHGKWIEGMVKVFEENKKSYGYGDRKVVIL
ncbi:hypothetical protein TrLO_g13784 [Triparma laevis f. longispina]|uniref:Acyltransferase n=2 Tax=Triparma laevis TaxID=1534972 RepID=A0A9W7E5G0_9STRA|nr:hypothetical protein TrLO_g13784 [Triparma laevis f. longispina]